MAIKVVQGLVGKAGNELNASQDVQQAARTSSAAASSSASISGAIAKAAQTNDAVVSALRSFRGNAVGSTKPLKDEGEAKSLAKEISEKIRGEKLEALSSHSTLSSVTSGTILLP